jgi:hypothetical protein
MVVATGLAAEILRESWPVQRELASAVMGEKLPNREDRYPVASTARRVDRAAMEFEIGKRAKRLNHLTGLARPTGENPSPVRAV